MILVIGGAYQGKLAYALEEYRRLEGAEETAVGEIVWDCCETQPMDYKKPIINGFEKEVLRLLDKKENPSEVITRDMEKLRGKIITAVDISCGVVPVDARMRLWREETGRALAVLSKEADKVIRMFCGIGTVIK